MGDKKMPGKELVQSLVRAMDLLECVAHGNFGRRLADISDELKINKTTAYNLLRTLSEHSYLIKDKSNHYHLGPALKELVRQEIRSEAMQYISGKLLSIVEILPESVASLAELCGSQIRIVQRVSPERPNTITYPMSYFLPLYTSCTGLCFLMDGLYAPSLYNYCPFEEHGVNLWKNMKNLEDFLQTSRKQGYVQMELSGTKCIGLAEPIGENMVLNLRCSKENLKKARKLLHESASDIRNRIGEM